MKNPQQPKGKSLRVYTNIMKGSGKRANMSGFRRAGLARRPAPVTIYRGLAAVIALENGQ